MEEKLATKGTRVTKEEGGDRTGLEPYGMHLKATAIPVHSVHLVAMNLAHSPFSFSPSPWFPLTA